MNAGELISRLSTYNPDTVIVLEVDLDEERLFPLNQLKPFQGGESNFVLLSSTDKKEFADMSAEERRKSFNTFVEMKQLKAARGQNT